MTPDDVVAARQLAEEQWVYDRRGEPGHRWPQKIRVLLLQALDYIEIRQPSIYEAVQIGRVEDLTEEVESLLGLLDRASVHLAWGPDVADPELHALRQEIQDALR